MITPKQMSKVTIFGPKNFLKQVIEDLYEMDAVHIEDYSKKSEQEVFDIGEPFPANEKYAEVLVKTRTLISNLGIQKMQVKPSTNTIEQIEKRIDELHSKANLLIEKKDYLALI